MKIWDQKVAPSRVIIDRVQPEIDGGKFAAKRYLDQSIVITATLLIDGHDKVKGHLLYRHADETEFITVPLIDKGNDQWQAEFTPERLGRYYFKVEAAMDRFGTWRSDIFKKQTAGQKIKTDLLTGSALLESLAQQSQSRSAQILDQAAGQLSAWAEAENKMKPEDLSSLLNDPALELMAYEVFDAQSAVMLDREVPIQVEPTLARFSSWYEFFPRSLTTESSPKGKWRHGTFKDAAKRLDYVRDLGFNVVYLPPIHPVGTAFRKGKNNSLQAESNDVGSPWAIGAKAGGHKAVHPDLGTLADFGHLIDRAHSLGLELAMDIAFQCSPDHPYVKEHPQWFKKRPDGTIQYAENPPKKYQDIYPFDFECEDWRSLWRELKSVLEFWVEQGIKVFRVDNPHTKAFHFWQWAIAEIKTKNPEVIFLAEAFTRPHLMAYLAKIGFSQSYTYFTWRNVKWELAQYMTELSETELADFFSPNFWPNTPDILPASLQKPQRSIYLQRLILAATLSSNYGIYGPVYELMVGAPKTAGGEEYLDSEKYELKVWDLEDPKSLAPDIRLINKIRNESPALQQNRGFQLHPVSNESLIAYSKSYGTERIVVVVNLDPDQVQSGLVELPLLDWKIDPSQPFEVHDLLTDARYFWTGWRNYVELDPKKFPAHILKVIRR